MLGIIIQARLGSTRLPGKVLKTFGGSSVLMFLINRLKTLKIPIVVATTTSKGDDKLCDYLSENRIDFYRGSEENVLQRFIDAAKEFNFTEIIRICADSPFLDLEYLNKMLASRSGQEDYLSFSYREKPTVLCHFGVFAELVSLTALRRVREEFNNSTYNEHVTFGVYNNPDLFKVKLKKLPADFDKADNIRLTIDTQEDYENVNYIFQNFVKSPNVTFLEICDFIIKDKELSNKMKAIIEKNQK